MSRRDARWAHAARVALAATGVVAVVALLLVLTVNYVLLNRLDHAVDSRLAATLASTLASGSPPLASGGSGDDLDDVPDFVWRVGADGVVTALSVAAPRLPDRAWQAGSVTLSSGGASFRYTAVPSTTGWLVAGESAARVHDVRGELLVVEAALGALLLLVTFTGSFVVGLRASAPIEQVRRRQAEFTADASHELRTPLSVIEAEVDLALDPTTRRRRVPGHARTGRLGEPPVAGHRRRPAVAGPGRRPGAGAPWGRDGRRGGGRGVGR